MSGSPRGHVGVQRTHRSPCVRLRAMARLRLGRSWEGWTIRRLDSDRRLSMAQQFAGLRPGARLTFGKVFGKLHPLTFLGERMGGQACEPGSRIAALMERAVTQNQNAFAKVRPCSTVRPRFRISGAGGQGSSGALGG
jgi:hypothetical protein